MRLRLWIWRVAPLMAAVTAGVHRGGAQSAGVTHAAVFLTLPAGARALALGDAWGGMANDETALFYQPAQLARVRTADVGGSFQRYIAGTTLAALAGAKPLGRGTVAIGLRVLDYGSEPELAFSGGQEGSATGRTISAQDVAITAGYGVAWRSHGGWRAGTALSWVRQRVADIAGSSVAADVGLAWTSLAGWDAAVALQNLGPNLTLGVVSAPLPLTWRAAVASPARALTADGRLRARAVGELRGIRTEHGTAAVGTELNWRTPRAGLSLAARAALATREPGADRRPLTAGGGISFGRLTVDYAYQGFELLGATHRIGLRVAARAR